jgi:hypothetical protein
VRTLRILTLIGILIAGAPRIAAADWQIAPFLGLTFAGDSTGLFNPEGGVQKTHWGLGGAVSQIGAGVFGVEGIFLYTPAFFENKNPSDFEQITPSVVDSRAIALMGNAVLTIPRSWSEYGLRPYVSGGLGLLYVSSTDARAALPISERLFGYDVGGGAVGFLTQRTGLRFDLRYFGTVRSNPVEPGGNSLGPVSVHFWTGSIGVVFRY